MGKMINVPIIKIPWSRSVQATAKNPPMSVYDTITAAPMVIPVTELKLNNVFNTFPDAWN